jgi:hypothetical protein
MASVIPAAGAAEPAPVQTPTARTTEPAAIAAEPPATASEPASDVDRLVAEGDGLVAEGKPAEGAERFSSAYLLMPAEQRVSGAGRNVVVLASNAYEAAWQATADPAHLEANQTLLRAYLADLESARAAGQPTAAADEHEQALRERSAAIERMLAEKRPAPEPAPPPAPKADPTTIEPQVELTFPPPDPRLRRNALILVGVGAGTAVVGGIMVIAGAVTASRAERDRDSVPAEEAGDARSDKVAGTVVATLGALVFSGSVMMLGVGSNRLGDLRREMALTLRPTIGGVVLRGRF